MFSRPILLIVIATCGLAYLHKTITTRTQTVGFIYIFIRQKWATGTTAHQYTTIKTTNQNNTSTRDIGTIHKTAPRKTERNWICPQCRPAMARGRYGHCIMEKPL